MELEGLQDRARIHAALADPHRLAIIDQLALTDATPSRLAASLHIQTNLLAHHLSTLEKAGLIERVRSQGDQRRRYLRLRPTTLHAILPPGHLTARRIVFICTENAARSQLAQALWGQQHPIPAVSGGTHPAPRIHPGAIQAAHRHGFDLPPKQPQLIPALEATDLVITVCDRANEHLSTTPGPRLHWSIPDPAANPTRQSYDTATTLLSERINTLQTTIQAG